MLGNENAERWLERLERNEDPQTENALRTPDGYCCLGIGCEEYRQVTGIGEWVFVSADDVESFYAAYAEEQGKQICDLAPTAEGDYIDHYAFRLPDGTIASSVLPRVVRDWLGLDNESGNVASKPGMALAAMNDRGVVFPNIAGMVRANPEDYLTEQAQ